MVVAGGEYTCEATINGGFLFARDGSVVNVTNAFAHNNIAARRGAVVSSWLYYWGCATAPQHERNESDAVVCRKNPYAVYSSSARRIQK